MKKCPFCAEEIQDEAIVCRYCGRDLTPPSIPAQLVQLSLFDPNIKNIAGIDVDLHRIIRMFGKDKWKAACYLAQISKIDFPAATNVLYPLYDSLANEINNLKEKDKIDAKISIQGEKLLEENSKIAQFNKDGIAYCPKCYSTSLSADKKGFGIGKAVIGAALVGPIGLVAGNIGSQKVKVTCLKCGHQFWAGKK